MQNDEYYTSTREELFQFVPTGLKHTLDVGCAEGIFSERLKKDRNVEAWGIEMVANVAEIAKNRLDKVLTGTFEEAYEELPKQYFDCVFFNDVLEHMACPEDCLKKVRDNIAPDGTVIASIPNMRYIQVLKDLVLKKDWEYKDFGIMDRTHLRFFTKKSITRMFEQCGYTIRRIEGIKPISPYCLTSIINVLLFNSINDVKYPQFVIIATPK